MMKVRNVMTTRKPRLRLLSALLAVAMLMTLLPAGAVTAFADESNPSVQLEIDPATGLPSEECLKKADKQEATADGTATTTYTGDGWEYLDESNPKMDYVYRKLTLTDGIFDFGSAVIKCDVVFILNGATVTDGTFGEQVFVQVDGGSISGGTFESNVNLRNGTVSGGTFNAYLYIYASSEIQNGTFNALVFVSSNNVETTISGGNFNKSNWGNNSIEVNVGTVKITGGNFDREFVGSDDSFKISGGVFAQEPETSWLTDSTQCKTAVRINAVEATVNDTITGVSTVYTVGEQKLDIKTDADYIWSDNSWPYVTCSPLGKETKKFTVEIPNKTGIEPVLSGVKCTNDALKLADDSYPEGSKGGKVSLSGDGWRYTSIYYKGSTRPSQRLELRDSSLAVDFSGKPVEYLVSLRNGAAIQNGTFEDMVSLLDGTIENGVFNSVQVNGAGEIKDGTFGYIYLNYSNRSTATISGGTFNGDDQWGLIRIHTGNLNITGGLFKAKLAEETYMSPTGTTTISGGTFLQNPTHTERTLEIKGGVFANEPDSKNLTGGATKYQVSVELPEGENATVNDGIEIAENGSFWVVGEQPITIQTDKAYHWKDAASGEILSTKKTNNFTITVDGAKTLKAVESIPVTVQFDANGHDEAPADQTVEYGETITAPKLTAEGYTFGGWYTDKACEGEKFDFTTAIKENTDLYAKWNINSYTVTFDANGHGTAPDAETADYNTTVKQPTDPTAEGYDFGGWYTDKECTNAFDFDTAITEDITLYAKWTEVKKPAAPEEPSNPEQPNQPETPSEPEKPDTPSNPNEPEKPDTPSTPDKPGEPDTPNTPDTPETPDQPSKPEEPKPMTYTIVIDNGTAYLDDGATAINKAEEGQTVTIKVNPEAITEGFEFDKWEVVSGEVILADETAPETTFEMPASDVELKAAVKTIEPAAAPLTGIEKAAVLTTGTVVAGAGVAAVGFAAYGIGVELTARLMLPAGVAMPTTRGELAVVLWKKAGSPAIPMEAPLSETEIALCWAADNQLVEPDAAPEERVSAMDVVKALKPSQSR